MKGPSGAAVAGPSAADRFYFPQLDGLRAVAFLAVFGFHFAASSRAPMAPLLAAMAEAGSFGVDLFFILSSFLITSLLFRERAAVGRIHVAAFWVRRALRIWPLYFIFVGIFIALKAPPAWFALGLLTFASNWALVYRPYSSIATHLWSIAVEEQFYLGWPLLLAGLRPRWLPAVSGAMVGGSILTRAALLAIGPTRTPDAIWMHTFDRLEPFALGGLLAWFWPRMSAGWRLPGWTGLASLGAAGALVSLLLYCAVPAGTLMVAPPVWAYTAVDALLALAMGGALLAGRGGFLAHPSFVALGRISFGLYVFHFPVIHGVLGVADLAWPLRLTVSFGITLALAAYSYRFLEAPFLRLKRRFTYVRSAPIP